MTAFSNCNEFCCPRQTKEIQRQIGRQHYSFDKEKYKSMWDWAFLKSTGYNDKEAYDACCANSKRRIRTSQRTPEDQTPYQNEGLRDLDGPYATLSWAAQRPFLVKTKKSKWLEEHEKRLQEEAKVQDKYTPAKYSMWPNLIKALVKLRRLERNRLEKAQQRPEMEQAVGEPLKEHIEGDLLNLFCKDKKRGSIVLDTPFGKYTQSEIKDARRVPDFVAALHLTAKKIKKRNAQKNGTPRSHRSLKGVLQDSLDHSYPGIKKKTMMSKPFDKLLKGKNVKLPELMPALRSHHKFFEKRTSKNYEKNRGKKEEKNRIKIIRKSSSGTHESRVKSNSNPNYRVHKAGKSKRRSSDIKLQSDINPPSNKERMKLRAKSMPKTIMSKSFDKLFEGKNVEMPELLPALKSQHQIAKNEEKKMDKEGGKSFSGTYKPKLKRNSEPSYGDRKTAKSRQRSSDGINPQISLHFHKMLRGKKGRIPGLKSPLMSSTETSPRSKKERIMSKRFDKLFEEKNVEMSELMPALKSQHELAHKRISKKEDKQMEGGDSSSGIHKSKLKKNSRRRSSDLSPQTSQQFHKMLRSNLKLKVSHASYKNKRHSVPISRRSLRLVLPGNALNLKKFSHYIRDSAPDRSIVRQDGSKRSIAYLSRKNISSLISNKFDIAEKKARIRGSIVSGADIAPSVMSAKKKAKVAKEAPRTDEDDFMFGTVRENYQPQHNQDPKTVNDLIANAEKVIRDSQSALKSVRDEIKNFDSEDLGEQAAQEKFQQDFVLEEKSVVQARIQELMKYVVIRDDFRSPKPPRDFVKENIEMLQKMQPQKRAQAKKKRKPNKFFSSTLEYLQMPKPAEISESLYTQQLLDKAFVSSKPLRIRRHKDFTSGNQKDRHEANTKADAFETKERDIQKSEICDMLRTECTSPDFIQKTKTQKLLRRAWNHEIELEKCCPKYC